MKFIDLNAQYQKYKNAIDGAIHAVLDHGQYINGPEVRALESALASFVGVSHAVGCSSGTTALQVALMALDIGPGDEVITSPFSFFATAEVILLQGAIPVYVDIDPKTYNLDPSQLADAITPKTRAIMPVSLYGQCADFDAIQTIADAHQLPVIEDAAQSFGARYKGRSSCALTTIACTSFFPSKPLGCYGDGGACFTDDDALAARIRRVIDHGQSARYQHDALGMNGRLDTIQAAVLCEKLRHFSEEIEQRQQVAAHYMQCLDPSIRQPIIEADNLSVFAQFTIEVGARDAVQAALQAKGIPTAVHYPKGLHQQPASRCDGRLSFPVTEAAAQRVLSLPFYPTMPRHLIEQVAEQVNRVVSEINTEAENAVS